MQTAAALQKREKQKIPETAASVAQKKSVIEPKETLAESGVPLFLQRLSASGPSWEPDPHFLRTSESNFAYGGDLTGGSGLDLQCKDVTAPSMQMNDRQQLHGLSGNEIGDYGIAYKPEGVNLRDKPGSKPDSTILVRLPFNTRMYVHSLSDGHYLVGTDDGRFGYVAVSHVKTGPPEPDAKIYHISPGDTALSISRRHYGGEARWGADHRFFVNGLVHVNQGPGERGIYKPDSRADWDTTVVRAGYMIWVPSLTFMRTLRGVVGSGSISYEAWQKVKRVVIAVGEFLLGTGAFIVGLLHGALESVWDVLVGLKDLLVLGYDLIKWLIGLISGDSKGIFDSLKDVNWDELVQGWIDNFQAKWDHDSILKRWHFRGWVIGYVIAEVLMLFFSGGVIQGIKWIGKSAKVAKVVSQIPKIAKLGESAKNAKIGQSFSRALASSKRSKADDAARAGKASEKLPGTTVAEKSVELASGKHMVRVQQIGDKMQIWVCSLCERFLGKIDRALGKTSAKGPTKSLHTRLTALRNKVDDIEKRLASGKLAPKDLPSELNQVGAHLRDLSKKYPNFDELLDFRKLPVTPEFKRFIKYTETPGTHYPASSYSRGKHVKGRTNVQRQSNSVEGDSQYLSDFTDADITKLEKEGLALARKGQGRVVERGGPNDYHVYVDLKRTVGYTNGNETSVMRVEITSGKEIHSHPRPASDL